MTNLLKSKIIKILLISMASLIVAFVSLLCAYAMCPTSSDIALAQESKASLNDSLAIADSSDEINGSAKETTSTNNLNIDLSSNVSTSPSFSDNRSNEDSYSSVNDDSNLVMHYTDLQKSLRKSLSNSQANFLSDKKPLTNNETLSNENLGSFDLRNVNGKNYVSNVKNQSPFGTCWAFAIIAASEISMQSKSNISYEDNPIDLSEHHLAWFANKHIPAFGEAGYDLNNSQAGEGGWYLNPSEKNASMNSGGYCYYGINSFSTLVGAQKESNYPYRGIIGRVLARLNSKYKTFDSYNDAIEAGAEPIYYSDNDDWSIDEKARFTNEYNLEKSNVLPIAQPIKNKEGKYVLNTKAMNIVKNQLMEGKGIAISYAADVSSHTEDASKSTERYINTTNWAHYTWKDDPKEYSNHCVCVVGYDDNYDKNNFTVNNPIKWDENQYNVYKLNGMNLNNNEEGNPYYTKTIEGKTVQVVLDKNSPLIELQAGSTKDYKLKETELANDNNGEPLYPDDSGKLMPDVDILCEYAREMSVSHTPPGNGAWICKNSWGASSQSFPNKSDWGKDGYFYLSYYDLSVDELITYEFSEKNNSYNDDLTYAYDFMPNFNSSTGYFLEDNYSDFNYSNVFTASDNTLIDSVSCITDAPSTKCQVSLYLLNDNASNPQDGKLLYQTEEEFPSSGFHKTNLNDPILVAKDKKFSVVIRELTPFLNNDENTLYYQSIPAPMNVGIESAKMYDEGVYYKSVINPGESFVTYYDKSKKLQCCSDLKDFVNTSDYYKMTKNLFDDDDDRKYYSIDNFPIKAYGKTVANPTPSPTHDDPSEPNVAASTADNNMIVYVSLMFFLSLAVIFARLSYYKKQSNL